MLAWFEVTGWRVVCFFFFSSRRRHTRYWRDWSSGRVLFRSLRGPLTRSGDGLRGRATAHRRAETPRRAPRASVRGQEGRARVRLAPFHGAHRGSNLLGAVTLGVP